MAGKRIICTTNNVEYSTIRNAMMEGARTAEELAEKTGVCTTCEGCKNELDNILSTVCTCNKVSLQTVIDAVNNGADTVEKVGEATKAGKTCGRCKNLIANVIEMGR